MPFADPEKKREYMRDYQARRRATDADYVERQRQALHKYRAKPGMREAINAARRAYSQTPEAKEKAKLYAREWRKRNPTYARRAVWKRKGAKYQEDNGYAGVLLLDPCAYCGGPAGEIDHIVPIVAGGTSSWDNLTSSCSACNRSKNDQSLLHFLLRRRRMTQLERA